MTPLLTLSLESFLPILIEGELPTEGKAIVIEVNSEVEVSLPLVKSPIMRPFKHSPGSSTLKLKQVRDPVSAPQSIILTNDFSPLQSSWPPKKRHMPSTSESRWSGVINKHG
jgi:hypothetical protein